MSQNYIWVVERYEKRFVGVKPKWKVTKLFPDYVVNAFVTRKAAQDYIRNINNTKKNYRIIKFKKTNKASKG